MTTGLSQEPWTTPHVAADRRLKGLYWRRVTGVRWGYGVAVRLGVLLGRIGITPNVVTLISLGLAVASGVAAASGSFLLAAALFLASGLFDVLDGIVARATGLSSKFGALLDSTADRVADAAPIIGMAYWMPPSRLLTALMLVALLAVVLPSYVRARAESLGGSLPPLSFRRPERVLTLWSTLLTAGLLGTTWTSIVLVTGVSLLIPASLLGTALALFRAHSTFDTGQLASEPPSALRPNGDSS